MKCGLQNSAVRCFGALRGKFPGQPFDREDRLAVRALGRIHAGEDRFAIHQHRARAALGFFAGDLGAGQPQTMTKEIGERLAGDRRQVVLLAVNGKRELCFHFFTTEK